MLNRQPYEVATAHMCLAKELEYDAENAKDDKEICLHLTNALGHYRMSRESGDDEDRAESEISILRVEESLLQHSPAHQI